MNITETHGYKVVTNWLSSKGYSPFAFQAETWEHIFQHHSGLVNAPTGYGKTFSVFLGAVIQFINQHPETFKSSKKNGLQLLWVTPLRALAKDIGRAMEEAIHEIGISWQVGIRNGDTDTSERQKQKRNMPEVLIITPESLHLLLAQKGYPEIFKSLSLIAIDEWHELIGGKRGILVELAVSRLVALSKQHRTQLSIWGISATIGNLEQAMEVLLYASKKKGYIIKANIHKPIEVLSVIPDEIEKYPWAGHLGIKLAEKIVPIIEQSNTTLIFINTRGMSETWYQTLLNVAPQLAGTIALHHGSIEQELRLWVEDALHTQKLKAVVCTASLDLGVDFRPVDTVIQVGSPKGVARFLQRAGRSGHRPGEVSKIYFLPTHSLELVEAAALKKAIGETAIETREPLLLCFDVLLQYLCTLAISEGFKAIEMLEEIKTTHCFSDMNEQEWQEVLLHITQGGTALQQYDEYRKVEIENGMYKIKSRRIAMRHRMHIGTIVSDAMLKVKLMNGKFIGVIEEWFISRLEPGTVFTLAGRNLELIGIKEMTVTVKPSSSKKSIVPSWMGGRMPLTANLGLMLRKTLDVALTKKAKEPELKALTPLFELQETLSHIPKENELLIEHIETKDGFHLFVYPFEGRLVHEAMAALLAWRISRKIPITFSFVMNDYGFELLSDQPIPVDDSNVYELFSIENLMNDITQSVNSVEMAKRKFRDIAVIGGLIFQGYPGEQKKARHLQSSASLLFKVFSDYEPDNLLLRQAYQEVFDQQMEEVRLRNALSRILKSKIIIQFPQQLTPFCFPIKVDSMRENMSSEQLEDRVRKMQQQLQ
ncbi:MAG: ligase-associated DNA damage response DEXH box helicase [Sediminibacterium sp.]|jgi:ATP-dependent helicase Lhr and Lhr-like helicase|uniref:ligase-associated DNA damage response DEXH box helicase n=1 Tax=Sediminibacterium sp. TaxID=1917865 RepID=UPI002ABA7552|nr:ligase-associated DNA damage response DEXH box helicase [Sediminibacterium sp.]MDZ4072812.1 ligase-associated DNA damage response DEXH box helicase [Sediminibacterium sp.]